MIAVCSYCRNVAGEKEPLDDKGVTHTICSDCYAHYMPFVSGMKLGQYLDRFDAPVAVVDDNARVMACNDQFLSALDRVENEVVGFLGGEVFECKHARLPEGCGQTRHCKTCTFRRAITTTIDTREPQKNLSAFVDTKDGRQDLVISTEVKDDMVLIRIETE